MKIIILNGSPKGDISVTMQYVRFLKENIKDAQWHIHNIASRVHIFEKDISKWNELMEEINSSDAVLWAFPLYHMLVSSQYKRFIELIFERKAEYAFNNKYSAILTTSIKFMDHTAHNYMHAVSDDLNMQVFGVYSAAMNDLLKKKNQEKLKLFGDSFISAVKRRASYPKKFNPVISVPFDYKPESADASVLSGNKKILLIGDISSGKNNLKKMITRFSGSFSGNLEIIDFNDLDIKGGCLGCLKCGYDNICSYSDKDGFMEFFNNKIFEADIIVIAGSIKDRYLSAKDKQFFDRSFFKTHQPFFAGKQIAYIIEGELSQNSNLRQILEAYPDLMRANLAGIVTDEPHDSAVIDRQLDELAYQLLQMSGSGYIKPQTFIGKGGMMIFRDTIWTQIRVVFIADHKYFKKYGLYNFPHKKIKNLIINSLLTSLMNLKFIRTVFQSKIKEGMIQPFKKVFPGK